MYTVEWSTPDELFESLNDRFLFNLDPCCTHENAKCAMHFTKEEDGLKQNWGGHRVFCNPPYGRELSRWVKKCYEESLKPKTFVVMLIPARTDTLWFHEYIKGKAYVEFIKGRIRFGGSKQNAPFPSMVVIFRGEK